MRELCEDFWRRYPALLYGLAYLLGCFTAFVPSYILLVPFGLIWWPLLFTFSWNHRLLIAIGVFFISFLKASVDYQLPELPQEGIYGKGVFEITSVHNKTTHFGKQWTYNGTLKSIETPQGFLGCLPCSISFKETKNFPHPKANCSYRLEGILLETNPRHYQMKTNLVMPWQPIKGSWSLAEWRYEAKNYVGAFLKKLVKNERSASFLVGIATGEFDDALMCFHFGRFGLLHIMAISGFHFAILASILNLLLGLLFSKKISTSFLIGILSIYFFFLGFGPSVLRAWITILITLIGGLAKKQGSGINSLGCALWAVLVYDPLFSLNMGFQFSFAVTAAILLFFNFSDRLLQCIFYKRKLSTAIQMNTRNQYGYLALVALRQALALMLAVNIVALPMTLNFFNQFPLMGLIYNLFFPFLISLSIFFFC